MFTKNAIDDTSCSIAIIGSGPRGISVLERLAVLLSSSKNKKTQKKLNIHIIDAVEIGAGRIWRKNQPQCFLMNTPARETTMFSGPPDEYGTRPGAGPSLAQWWLEVDPLNAVPDGLAPRVIYGKYLTFVFNKIMETLVKYSTVTLIEDTALDLKRNANMEWIIILGKNKALLAHRVVLATGHTKTMLDKNHLEFQIFSNSKKDKHYIHGDSAADMDLSKILPQSKVGIIGCGLAFYDVLAALTEGRGGRFLVNADGKYTYLRSGNEPIIYAGSRSGVPFPARAVNEKPADYSYKSVLFTVERILQIQELRQHRKLNFNEDLLPWLEAEMQLVQVASILRLQCGEELTCKFIKKTIENIDGDLEVTQPKQIVLLTATQFGLKDIELVDLRKWSRPFHGCKFNTAIEYEEALKAWICHDISNALLGNLTSPIKSATDVLRDVRPILKLAVDFAGLTPLSHKEDFLNTFVPIYSMLSAGPPVHRLKQVLALMQSGLLTFAGPRAQFSLSDSGDGFLISSPDLPNTEYLVDTLVDARIPAPNIHTDISVLTKCLFERGILTSFTNSLGNFSFDTGGVSVTLAPFHPITASGPEKSLYVLGIPTEYTRWLMHIGSGRPGQWGQFTQDANAIANDLMSVLVINDLNNEINNKQLETIIS